MREATVPSPRWAGGAPGARAELPLQPMEAHAGEGKCPKEALSTQKAHAGVGLQASNSMGTPAVSCGREPIKERGSVRKPHHEEEGMETTDEPTTFPVPCTIVE